MIIQEYKRPYSSKNKKTGKVTVVNEPMIELKCDKCKKIHSRTRKHFRKMSKNSLFDMHYCNNCWAYIQNNRSDRKEKNRQGQIKRYAAMSDEEKKKIFGRPGANAGEKNAMKRPEVRAKVSATRSKLMEDPAFRQKFVQGSIDAWKRGAYTVVNDANCKTKWHEYKHSSGKIYKVQGTWELKFIEWLDKNNLSFECHQGRIPFIDDNGIERSYYPDFYVYEWKAYVDPKADHWYKKQHRKFELLREQHPDKEILVLTKQKLLNLGIIL